MRFVRPSHANVVNDGQLDIANDATAEIRPGATVTLTGAITVGQRNNAGTLSQLMASGGTVSASKLVVANKSEGDAYVELSGADVTVNNLNIGSSVAERAGVNSTLVLADGSLAITGGSGILRMGETFDLIKGATDYGALTLGADDASAWSLTTNGDVLQATYLVPEPATLALVALGAAATLRRRGRR
ncbi:MAG: PEP-CTERM sorting domain-containing protein [Planctomycetota bacterium]